MHDEVSGVTLPVGSQWPPSKLPAAEINTWSQAGHNWVLSVWKMLFGKVHRNLDFLSSNYTIMPQGPPGCSENQWTYQSHLLLRVLGSPSTNEHSQCTQWDPGGLEEWLLLSQRWAGAEHQPLKDACGPLMGKYCSDQWQKLLQMWRTLFRQMREPSNYFHSKVGNE